METKELKVVKLEFFFFPVLENMGLHVLLCLCKNHIHRILRINGKLN